MAFSRLKSLKSLKRTMGFEQYVVVLDACVLVPMPLCDTLLRLAEEPAFYTPKWSGAILDEMRGALVKNLRHSEESSARRVEAMKNAFPEALVHGYEGLIPAMTNHVKDRHVVAAAIRCGAHAIVTNNLKHFPPSSLKHSGIECVSPDGFIEDQYHLNPDQFITILEQQAADIEWTLPELIAKHVPCLRRLIVIKS